MKKLLKSKAFRTIALFTLSFALLYNLVWLINYASYSKLIDEKYSVLPTSSLSRIYNADGISYSMKKPGYLSFTGNTASVSSDMRITILVWPSFMCKGVKEYGLALYDEEEDTCYMMYVDENMKFDSRHSTGLTQDGETKAKRLLEELQAEVLSQYDLMEKEFGYA